jgi:hypothetical protein
VLEILRQRDIPACAALAWLREHVPCHGGVSKAL